MITMAKFIILMGVIFIIIGVGFLLFDKIPFLGKLPGDIQIRGKYSSLYFPIVTCLVISVVLSILMNIFFRK